MITCKRVLRGARAGAERRLALAPFYIVLVFVLCVMCACTTAAPPATNSTTSVKPKPQIELEVVYDPTPDIEAITKAVQKELDSLKNPTDENVEAFVAKVDEQSMQYLSQNLNTSIQECLVHLLRGFDYAVDDVSVGDDTVTATATITITCLDGAEAMEAARQQVLTEEEMQTLATLYASGDDEDWVELVGHLVDVVYANLDSTTTMITNEVQLSFTKQDNVWTVDSTSLTTLAEAITAGIVS